MASTEGQTVHRVLLVDDDDALLGRLRGLLEPNGFEVVAASGVTEALKCIATESFEVLIADPSADYFTVISAMRRTQPAALTMLLSTFPEESAMEAIVLEAVILEVDEIVVKAVEVRRLAELVRNRLLIRRPVNRHNEESVSTILRRCSGEVVKNWLVRARQARELNHLALKDEERTGHLSKLIDDLVRRLNETIAGLPQDSDANHSAAVLHGELRYAQGYTPEMLVHESRILQVALFGTLKDNMNDSDFSVLLRDVMTIADEVDAQLTQTIGGFMKLTKTPKPTQLAA